MIKAYLKYIFKRKTVNQIENDFVRVLCLRILELAKGVDDQKIALLLKQLKTDSRTIKITDLGAGSRVNNSPVKQVKSIAKSAVSKPKQLKLVSSLALFFESKSILELGTSLGISAAYFAQTNKKANIYTIEGCPEITKIAAANFKSLGINNVHQFTGEFDEKLNEVLALIKKPEFIFIDGNHTYDATTKYFHYFLKEANKNAVLIFDDIHWSAEMEKAWNEIISHQSSVLTLDFFDFGVVFLDVTFPKEHLVLKY